MTASLGSEDGPRRIDAYVLVHRIGKGGMGEVWRAIDTARGNRLVALKLLRPDMLLDDLLKQRFKQECRLAASINHLHVLKVFDYSINDPPYIAMDLIEGETLAAVLKQGPLAPERAVDIVGQVAAALQAAHDKGLQHQDVKSSNILLERAARPNSDHAYLFDWGIARPIDTSDVSVETQPRPFGTAAYIAPERLRDDAGANHRADLYSLTVVLFECLEGRLPFVGTEAEVITAQLRDEPPPLSPRLPEGLRAVVAKGLAKRPEDRYQSARELADAARSALEVSNSHAAAEIPAQPDEADPRTPALRPVDEPPRGPAQVVPLPRPAAPETPPARGFLWTVTGAGIGLVLTLTLLWTGRIDGAMVAWVLPALVVACAAVAWGVDGLYPRRTDQPGPDDATRQPRPGGFPPTRG